jgi:hypothetical protein
MPLLARMPTGLPAVERLELVHPATVHDPGYDLAHVVGLARVLRHDTVDLLRVVERFLRLLERPGHPLLPVQIRDYLAHYGRGVLVILGEVVGDAGGAGVHGGSTQLLRAHFLAGRGLYEGRAPQKDRTLLLDYDHLIAHRRHVRPARRAGSHHRRNLRDALRRHLGLVVEDAPEVPLVREDLVLQGQVSPPGID